MWCRKLYVPNTTCWFLICQDQFLTSAPIHLQQLCSCRAMKFESFSCHHTTRIKTWSIYFFSSHRLHLLTGFVVSLDRFFYSLDTDTTRPKWRDLKCPHWHSRKVANHDRFSTSRAGPKCPESRLVQLQTALETSRINSYQPVSKK